MSHFEHDEAKLAGKLEKFVSDYKDCELLAEAAWLIRHGSDIELILNGIYMAGVAAGVKQMRETIGAGNRK